MLKPLDSELEAMLDGSPLVDDVLLSNSNNRRMDHGSSGNDSNPSNTFGNFSGWQGVKW
jgi:hypothetical protein